MSRLRVVLTVRVKQAKCKGGKWVDGKDCEKGGQECFARTDGAKAQCI